MLSSEISVCDSLRIACFCWLLHLSSDVKDVGYVIVRLLFRPHCLAKDNSYRTMISPIIAKIISIGLAVQG
jgi:hypothetical protein